MLSVTPIASPTSTFVLKRSYLTLGDSRFELAFHLCELESVSGDLEVRLPL
jgi:hypothetical protein